MKKLKIFALKKPLLFTLLIMTFALIFFYAPTEKLYLLFCDKQYATFLGELTNKMAVSIILIIVLIKFDLNKGIGLTTFPNRLKEWSIAWPLMIILMISLLSLIFGNVTIDTSRPFMVTVYTLMNFFIGLSEELLVRGLILGILLLKWGNTRKGIYLSVIVSSVIFGIAHLGNFIAMPSILLATLSQVLYAIFIGIFFAACVLRSKTIWPVIILHSTIDFFGQIQQIAVGGGIEAANKALASTSLLQALQPIAIYFMLASYAFFILKKVTPADIQYKFSNNNKKNCSTDVVHEQL